MKRLAPFLVSVYLTACSTETILIAHRERTQEDAGDADAEADSDAALAHESGVQDAELAADDAMAEDGCRTTEDCGDGNYCEKSQRLDRYGTCTERPTDCETTWSPVCGSDNINYFNDCIRKRRGVSFSMPGDCQAESLACDLLTLAPCPTGTFCGRLRTLVPDDVAVFCAVDLLAIPGACWAIPDCPDPPAAGGMLWVPCSPVPPATFGGSSPGGGPGSGAGGGSFGGGAGGNFGVPDIKCVDTCRAIRSELVHVPSSAFSSPVCTR